MEPHWIPMGRTFDGYYRWKGSSSKNSTAAINYLKPRIDIEEGKPEKYDIYIDGNDLDPEDGLEIPAIQTSLDYVIYNNNDLSNIDFFDTNSFSNNAKIKHMSNSLIKELKENWNNLSKKVKYIYRILLYLALGAMSTSLIVIGIMIVKGTIFKDTITDLMKKNMGKTDDDDLPNEYYEKKFTNQWIFTFISLILIIIVIILTISSAGVVSKLTSTYNYGEKVLDKVKVYAKAFMNTGKNSFLQDGLGTKKDIDENTLDKDGNKLIDRMGPSLHGQKLDELVDNNGNRLYLSYLEIPYYDFNGNVQTGEMIVHRQLADEVLLIFQDLYNIQYPIEKMELVDNYGADDWKSIEANNTSAFNYRGVNDGPISKGLSNHAYGECIDINPLINPYIDNYWGGGTPDTSHDDKYIDREGMAGWSEIDKKAKADEGTQVYDIFTKYGWRWLKYAGGGNDLDSQHFDKLDPSNAQTIDWSNVASGSSSSKKSGSSSKSSARSTSSTGSNLSTDSNITSFTTYTLTDQELTGLAAVAFSEQGTLRGAASEASLMANLFELHHNGQCHGVTGGAGLYKMVGAPPSDEEYFWFFDASNYIDSGHLASYAGGGPVTEEMKAVVKSVLVDGIRTLPGYVDEHDSWSGKDYRALLDGQDVTYSRESYIQFKTRLHNNSGSSYTFWGWSDTENPASDPFGYISEEARQRIGEFHYDFDGNISGSSGRTVELSFITNFEGLYMIESNYNWNNYVGHNIIYMICGFILTALKAMLHYIFYFRMLLIAILIAITPAVLIINSLLKIKGNRGIFKKWFILYIECVFYKPLIQIVYYIFAKNNHKEIEENPFYIMFPAIAILLITIIYIRKTFKDFRKKETTPEEEEGE